MNFRRLEYFVMLGQTGNLRRAAEMLHISPPTLSKAMKVLEEELETSLWVRDGRKIILTDAGRNLFKRAPRLIDELKTLKDSLSDGDSDLHTVKIGTFEVFSTYFLTFLDALKWDKHSLELHELLPGALERHIAQGDLDLGITYMPVAHPDLDFMKLRSIEMGVYTRVGAFEGVPQKELPFVTPVMPLQGMPTKARGLDGWPDDAYRRRVLHRVTLLESALELCRQGRVAGYFPVFIVEEHNRRVSAGYRLERRKTPYPDRVCRADVFLVKRKSFAENEVVRQLAKAVRVICRA